MKLVVGNQKNYLTKEKVLEFIKGLQKCWGSARWAKCFLL